MYFIMRIAYTILIIHDSAYGIYYYNINNIMMSNIVFCTYRLTEFQSVLFKLCVLIYPRRHYKILCKIIKIVFIEI